MTMKILSIPEAAQTAGDDFVTNFFWRWNPILQRVMRFRDSKECGDLRSVRFTFARAKSRAVSRELFLYDHFGAMLDGACEVAGGMLPSLLHLSVSRDANLLFGLARFENGIACEFECNECLANSLPDICFVKGNFSNGHFTNQPLVGYLDEGGVLVADDNNYSLLNMDYAGMEPAAGPIEHMLARFNIAVERGLTEKGAGRSTEIVKLIKEAL